MWVCVVRGWGARSLERSWGGILTPITSGAVTTRLPQDSLRTSEPLHQTRHRINPPSIGQSRRSLVGTWSEEPVPGRRWPSGSSLGSLTQAFRGASQRGRVTVYPGPSRCHTGHAPRTKRAMVKGVCDSCQWRVQVQVPDLGQTFSLATPKWEAEGGPECRLHS